MALFEVESPCIVGALSDSAQNHLTCALSRGCQEDSAKGCKKFQISNFRFHVVNLEPIDLHETLQVFSTWSSTILIKPCWHHFESISYILQPLRCSQYYVEAVSTNIYFSLNYCRFVCLRWSPELCHGHFFIQGECTRPMPTAILRAGLRVEMVSQKGRLVDFRKRVGSWLWVILDREMSGKSEGKGTRWRVRNRVVQSSLIQCRHR